MKSNHLITLLTAGALALALAGPASAEDVPAPTASDMPVASAEATQAPASGAVDMSNPYTGMLSLEAIASDADAGTLSTRYASTGANLIGYYAQSNQQTLSGFMTANGAQIAAITGTSNLSVNDLNASSMNALSQSMMANGFALDTTSYDNMQSYAQDVLSGAGSMDSVLTAQGSEWATQMASMRAPQLVAPGVPSAGKMPAVPQEAFAFGMMYDKSVGSLISDFPDTWSAMQQNGTLTPAQQNAWESAMGNAAAASVTTSGQMLPSPCWAGALAVAGTGNPQDANQYGGNDCGGCQVTGLYLHGQMANMFTTGANSQTTLNPTEWSQLQNWQTPSLGNSLSGTLSGGCGGQATTDAAQGAVDTTLPGVFGQLNGTN